LNKLQEANFCGCQKNYISEKPVLIGCIREGELKTKELQDKFYNCTIQYGEHYSDIGDNNYVEHYGRWSWNPQKCMVQKTKMDSDIEKVLNVKINYI
jgi:hypothetical protein